MQTPKNKGELRLKRDGNTLTLYGGEEPRAEVELTQENTDKLGYQKLHRKFKITKTALKIIIELLKFEDGKHDCADLFFNNDTPSIQAILGNELLLEQMKSKYCAKQIKSMKKFVCKGNALLLYDGDKPYIKIELSSENAKRFGYQECHRSLMITQSTLKEIDELLTDENGKLFCANLFFNHDITFIHLQLKNPLPVEAIKNCAKQITPITIFGYKGNTLLLYDGDKPYIRIELSHENAINLGSKERYRALRITQSNLEEIEELLTFEDGKRFCANLFFNHNTESIQANLAKGLQVQDIKLQHYVKQMLKNEGITNLIDRITKLAIHLFGKSSDLEQQTQNCLKAIDTMTRKRSLHELPSFLTLADIEPAKKNRTISVS